MRQVDLSLHRAAGHPRSVLSDYLREHSADPRTVCDHFWKGVALGPHDKLSGSFQRLKLKLMNVFSRDSIFSASFFPLANDSLRKIADYLDDAEALVDQEANGLRLPLAYLNAELTHTLSARVVDALGAVEHFNHHDHGDFKTIDELVGKKLIP